MRLLIQVAVTREFRLLKRKGLGVPTTKRGLVSLHAACGCVMPKNYDTIAKRTTVQN